MGKHTCGLSAEIRKYNADPACPGCVSVDYISAKPAAPAEKAREWKNIVRLQYRAEDGVTVEVLTPPVHVREVDPRETWEKVERLAEALDSAPVIRLGESLEEFKPRYQAWYRHKVGTLRAFKGGER